MSKTPSTFRQSLFQSTGHPFSPWSNFLIYFSSSILFELKLILQKKDNAQRFLNELGKFSQDGENQVFISFGKPSANQLTIDNWLKIWSFSPIWRFAKINQFNLLEFDFELIWNAGGMWISNMRSTFPQINVDLIKSINIFHSNKSFNLFFFPSFCRGEFCILSIFIARSSWLI